MDWEFSSEFLISNMPVGIGELTRLETLGAFVVSPSSVGGAEIQELERLNQLKGSLCIKNIKHVREPRDAKQANLKSKNKLSRLCLLWGDANNANEEEKDRSKGVLESLEPHLNIQSLLIQDYPGVELAAWVGNCAVTLPNLRVLCLKNMPNAVHHLHQLPPNLTNLQIVGCPKLRFHPKLRLPSSIKELSVGASNDPALSSVEALPHLSRLHIAYFHQLETLSGAPLRRLTSLQSLSINSCSGVKKLLTGLENLAKTLERFEIYQCEELDCITDDGLRNLTSLHLLRFRSCWGLTSLSDNSSLLQQLTALLALILSDCPKLEISAIPFQHFVSLKDLEFINLPQMTDLPDGIQHLTTLRNLRIDYCKNLRTLPRWLQQHLPASLSSLHITGCHPDLHGRCEMDKGEDWQKIAHLEYVYNTE